MIVHVSFQIEALATGRDQHLTHESVTFICLSESAIAAQYKSSNVPMEGHQSNK